VPYRDALDKQRAHRQAVLDGRADPVLWLLEHPPVVTEGRRTPPIPTPVATLSEHGIDWVRTERGGLATYHGPGQLVGYLIADIRKLGLTVKATVWALEQGLVSWLSGHGLRASRRPGYPGVWVGHAKIGAVGLHFQRSVSMHGFALNLTTALEPFSLIVPCGVRDGSVTNLTALVGPGAPDPARAAPSVAREILAALRDPAPCSPV
jgi:lipoyl(octanoyl) transferase